MTLNTFLIAHGSALILPLAVIEGPIVTIVTGFLTAQGYFDGYWVLPLLICGDVIGDIGYYWVGCAGIAPLGVVGRWLGVRGALAPGLQHDLARRATWMLLIGSGLLRLPLRRFILVNLLASIPKSAVLFGAGFYFGDHYPFFERHAVLGFSMLCVLGVASIVMALRRPEGIGAGR